MGTTVGVFSGIVTEDDGIQIRGDLERAAGSNGKRIFLVLHGLTSARNRVHTLQTAETIRAFGYDTLRFDLFGHGETGGEFRRHTLYKWIGNTMTVIDAVRKMKYEEIWLSGHSQGGLVAALVAGMEPDRIRGMILRAPAFSIPAWCRQGNMLGWTFDPRSIPDVIKIPGGQELEGNYVRTAGTLYVERAAEAFHGPVMIIHGERDDLIPAADSLEMAKKYQDCRVSVIPGEGHHFDHDPGAMIRAIQGFLEERQGTQEAETQIR